MQTNAKTPLVLDKLAESAFNAKLKATMTKVEEASQEAPIQFLLRSGYHFSDGTEGTIFIIHLSNAWKKHIKSKGWLKSDEAKKTAVGTFVLNNKSVEVLLQKGQMSNNLFQKAVKKSNVLKQFKWSIVEAMEENQAPLEENQNEDQSLAAEIAEAREQFEQLSKKYKAVNKALKAATEKTEKEKLLKGRNSIIKRLKIECKEWEERIAVVDAELQQSADYQGAQKYYQQWMELINKLKAAKTNPDADKESILLQEEQLYGKALSDIDGFNASLKGVMEVEVVEQSVRKLEKHLNQWKKMTNNGQNAQLAKDFQQLEQKYEEIKNGWAVLRPLLSEWQGYKSEIEELQAKGETLPEELIHNFLESNERIQTAF